MCDGYILDVDCTLKLFSFFFLCAFFLWFACLTHEETKICGNLQLAVLANLHVFDKGMRVSWNRMDTSTALY